jgi:hypothetical protein
MKGWVLTRPWRHFGALVLVGLPSANVPFNVIVVDPTASNTVYAGADNGMWGSRDGGATWTYMGPEVGVPNVAVFDLQIQASTRKVFGFTFGRGAFMLTPP